MKGIYKVKVKCTLVQAQRLCTGRTVHRGSRGIALPFHDRGTRRGWRFSVTTRPLFTPGKDPLYKRLGGPQGRSGEVRKIPPPPGVDPRTVQPVASHYTEWAKKAIYNQTKIQNHMSIRQVWSTSHITMFFLISPPLLRAVTILYANQATVQYLIGKHISCSAAPTVLCLLDLCA